MGRLEVFLNTIILDEEWNIKSVDSSYQAIGEFRGREEYNTLVFIYLPTIDMFIHMESDDGIVYINKRKVYTIKDPDYRHHDSMAMKAMENDDTFSNYDASDLYENDNILETLEDDYNSVRGFCYKNNVYIYNVGGVNKYKSKAVLKLKTYIDDYWWEKG